MCGNLIKQRNSEAQVLPVAVYFKLIFKDWDPLTEQHPRAHLHKNEENVFKCSNL